MYFGLSGYDPDGAGRLGFFVIAGIGLRPVSNGFGWVARAFSGLPQCRRRGAGRARNPHPKQAPNALVTPREIH